MQTHTLAFLQLSFHFAADLCYHYKNLSEANRNRIHKTPLSGPVLCDIQLPEGWYRFVGATGTKMPTTRVPAFRCRTDWPGWLVGSDPTMEDVEVHRTVCLSNRNNGCKYFKKYKIKNNTNKQTNKKQKTKGKNRKYWYSGQTDYHLERPLTK